MKHLFKIVVMTALVFRAGHAMQPAAPGKPLLKPVSKPAPSAVTTAFKAADALQNLLNSFETYLINRNLEKKAKQSNDFPATLNTKITALLDLISTLPTEKQALRTAVGDAMANLLAYRKKADDRTLPELRQKLDRAIEALAQDLNTAYGTLENYDEKSNKVTITFNKELNAAQLETVFSLLSKKDISNLQLASRSRITFETSPTGTEPRLIVVALNKALVDNAQPGLKKTEPAQVKLSRKLPNNKLAIEFSRPLFESEKTLIKYAYGIIGTPVSFSALGQQLELTYDEFDNPETYVRQLNNLLRY